MTKPGFHNDKSKILGAEKIPETDKQFSSSHLNSHIVKFE